MDIASMLARISSAGLSLTVQGGELRVRPRERLTDELRAEIKAAKIMLIAEIQPHRAWQVRAPGQTPFSVRVHPGATRQEMRALYGPSAECVPITSLAGRPATDAEGRH